MTKHREPRWIAIQTIEKVLKGGELQNILDKFLESPLMSSKDKPLITELVYGYFRLKARLEFILSLKIRARFKKLPKRFILCLALATYEILYLNKIPEYATLNWYVETIKKKIDKKLTSLANGVLRNISREKAEFLSKDYFKTHTKTQKDFWSVYYSIPLYLLDMIIAQYGKERALYFLEKSITKPFIGIRINLKNKHSLKILDEIIKQKKYKLYENNNLFGFNENPKELNLLEMEQRGIISRKSVESQKILLDLDYHIWPTPIWDMCAGLGGKTFFLVEHNKSPVWASDIDLKKIIKMKREKTRLGFRKVPIFLADATKSPPIRKVPETLLLDVPCSGLGVLSRRPDIKWKMHISRIKELKLLQYKILSNACDFLLSGGKIIYITCTWNVEENEDQIFNIMKEKKGLLEIEKEIKIDFKSKYKEFFYGVVLKKK